MDTKVASGKTALETAMCLRARCMSVESKPFKEEEARVFCTHFKVDFGVPIEVNYNPLYLTYYENSHNDVSKSRTARNSITRMRQAFVNEVAESMQNNYETAVMFCECLSMLECALGNLPISSSYSKNYESSFLCHEHLTYVENENDNEVTLKVYDPDQGFLLLKTFANFITKAVAENNTPYLTIPAVRGYRFEECVLRRLQCLCISAIYLESQTVKHKKFDFSITGECKHMDEPVRCIRSGSIYHLRSGHHSIDGIFLGYAEDSWYLLFIQVSLGSYRSHESKEMSIRGLVPKDEDKDRRVPESTRN